VLATSVALNVVSELPEIVVAHWHQNGRWVAVDVTGENHRGERPALDPIYWADLCELPEDVTLRPLADEDFLG
jgi:hypothetical protein